MTSRTNRTINPFIVVFVLVTTATTLAGKIIYVDADAAGANNGSSWADAYNYLQDALAAAGSGNEIHVAQGVYKPDQGAGITPGNREATFQLINGVTLKGGYAGFGEPDPNARDVSLYETILSGDLAGDDVDVGKPAELRYEPTRAENSYHVVTGSGTDATAVLDGFTITGGYTGFHLGSGGYGGGMYIYGSGSPTSINCTYTGNWGHDGGGIGNYKGSPTLINCNFIGNSANHGVGEGGGMHTSGERQSSLTLVNCTFIQNFAGRQGGAMFNEATNLIAVNCAFIGNSAHYGGAMENVPVNATVINCTFAGNSAANGNALSVDHGWGCCSNLQIVNCVLWDGGNEVFNGDNSQIEISYSDVQGGWPGEGNIDAHPCFAEPGYWDVNGVWVDGDYHLLSDSLCIDAGDPNYIPKPNETDLDGKPRIIGCRIDMGAYEYSPPILAEVRISPRTINMASKGKWITCYIWLPDEYDVTDVDPNSILIEEQIKAELLSVNEQEQVALAKFSREEVQQILELGQVELTITGRLMDGTVFEGTDMIKVINKAGK